MKKIFSFLFIAFIFSSCNKCQDCTCESVTQEVCRAAYDSYDDYNEAIAALELLGCNCN